MFTHYTAPPNDAWIHQSFSTKAAQKGAVVRRSLAWVNREVGRATFDAEVCKRGYPLIETADQLVVVCHNGPIRLLF